MPRGGQNMKTADEKHLAGTLKPARERKRRAEADARCTRLLADASPLPAPPRDLTPAERKVWTELAPQTQAAGTYTSADLSALRLLCSSMARLRDPELPPKSAPSLSITVQRGLASFGLDPANRNRTPMVESEDVEAMLEQKYPIGVPVPYAQRSAQHPEGREA